MDAGPSAGASRVRPTARAKDPVGVGDESMGSTSARANEHKDTGGNTDTVVSSTSKLI